MVGNTISQYTIVSKLGEGGMGVVYRAHDKKLRRDVAIKVLSPALAKSSDWLDRFRQEARAVGSLNHPNSLVVYHTGTHDDAPYMVSELLEGTTLRKRLEDGPLGQRKLFDYALQTAKGLAAAHEKGIVHRDIKPENIFITNDGRTKILDFGLAKLSARSEKALTGTGETAELSTEPGILMGTIAYMSPEQIKGLRVDHRSDIFSFGSVLYEMVSGRRAFHGETQAETISAILHDDPPELWKTNDDVPPAFECLVRHCLKKNAAERFHSAKDLAFSLESISGTSGASDAGIAGAPTLAHRPLWPKLLRSAVLTASLVSVFLFVAVVIMAWKMAGSPRPGDNSRLQGVTQVTTWPGLDVHPSISPDGNSIAYSSDHNGGFEIYVRPIADDGRENQITNDGQANFEPAWSPDRLLLQKSPRYLDRSILRGKCPADFAVWLSPCLVSGWNRYRFSVRPYHSCIGPVGSITTAVNHLASSG